MDDSEAEDRDDVGHDGHYDTPEVLLAGVLVEEEGSGLPHGNGHVIVGHCR